MRTAVTMIFNEESWSGESRPATTMIRVMGRYDDFTGVTVVVDLR